MKNNLRKVMIASVVLGITQTVWVHDLPAVQAASASNSISQTKTTLKTLANVPGVKLSNKSSVKISDVNVLTQDEGKLVTYTLTYTNNEKKSLQLVDYWTKVRSKGGTSYTSKLLAQDAEKKSVAAGSTLSVTYVTTVGKNVQLSNLNFEIVKWDFSKPNYENVLGKINIPSSYVVATPMNTSKKVRINDVPVKIKVQSLQTFAASDTNNYASVKINLHNVGYKGLENPGVKWILRTAGGSSYPLNINANEATYSLQPQESKSINYITTIPKKVKLDGAELIMVQENEAEKSVIPLATMQMPKASTIKSSEIAVGKQNVITLEDNKGKIETQVKDVSYSQVHWNNYYTVSFRLKNIGSREVAVPKYEFSVQNAKGNDYPLTTKALDDLKLKPDEERLIRLTFKLPYEEASGTLRLVMNTPKAENAESKEIKFSYPAGVYILPEATSLQKSIGAENTLQLQNGTLGVTWNSIQRLPWENADVLSARVTLRNISTNTLKLPELKGMLSIDSADIPDTQLLTSQSSALLGPGMSVDIHLLTTLPTNLDVTQLQVALSEVTGENSSELIRLTHIGQLPAIPTIDVGNNYAINASGKKAEMKVKRTLIYPGTSSDIVYTELEVKNVEDRQVDLAKLTGYYESKNGEYYKTTVKQIDYPAGPGNSALVTVWAKIPRKTIVSDMKLLVGQTVAGESTTGTQGTQGTSGKGYVDAVSFALKPDQESAQETIKHINIYPYTLETKDFKATLSGGTTVNLSWNYDASRINDLNLPENEHKLILQIIEPTGKSFDKEIILDKDLKEGNNQFINWTIQDVVFDDRRSGAYTIAIYDEFQGQRIKLATQAMGFAPAVGNLPGGE